jgi:hypothetical protein
MESRMYVYIMAKIAHDAAIHGDVCGSARVCLPFRRALGDFSTIVEPCEYDDLTFIIIP